MKIWYQSNSTYRFDPAMDAYGKNLEEQCQRAARPGTEVFVTGVPVHGDSIDKYKSIMYFHAQQAINNMVKAEKEGFDAYVMGCSFDPGVSVGREIVGIPIVAIAHANLYMAAMMGEQFTVITCEPYIAEKYRQLVREYALTTKYMASNYVVPVTEHELAAVLKSGDPKPMAEKFKKVARKAVEDGASVLIPIPAHISQLFYKTGGLSNLDGATVFDPVAVAVKVAEMLVDMKKLGIEYSQTPMVAARPDKKLLKKNLDLYSGCFRIEC